MPSWVPLGFSKLTSCFLCEPDSRLVVDRRPPLFSMVGLGPITERYILIASVDHVRSFADLHQLDRGIAPQVSALRREMQADGPPLLMTEHGRVPACVDDEDGHDAHCFHAHFLLFQSSGDISKHCQSYFLHSDSFSSLSDALEYAGQCENYHLLSPSDNDYTVFSGALNVPRQFFRKMVAYVEGDASIADWRDHPSYDKAKENAAFERKRQGIVS